MIFDREYQDNLVKRMIFPASDTWSTRYIHEEGQKKRKEIVSIKVQGEEVSTDVETSSSYPGGPAKIIGEGGYTQ